MVNEITSPNGMYFAPIKGQCHSFTNDLLRDVSVQIMQSKARHGLKNFHIFKNVTLQGQS